MTNQVYIPVNCFKLSVYILIILCREIKLCIDRSWWRRVAQLFTSTHSTGKSKYSRALFWSYIAGKYTRVISDPLSSTLYRICYLFNSTLPFEKICKKSRKTIVYYILLLIINLHWKYSSSFFAVTDVDGDRQRGHWPGDRRGGQKVVWIPGGPATESSCGWRNQVCSGCHQTRF